jgi:DedD protein
MRLPSFLQRKHQADRATVAAAASVADEGDAVLAARTRARRRLIGAVVLLGIGIVGFPLLFETQPRPLSPDIPIEIVGRAAAPATPPPVVVPATPSPAVTPAPVAPRPPPPAPLSEPVPAATAAVITERAGDAGIEVPPPKATPVAPPAAKTASSAVKTERAASTPPREPVARPVAAAQAPQPSGPVTAAASRPAGPATASTANPTASPPTRTHDDGARAQALLNGGTPAASADAASPASASRYVVQVGAYTDANALREARQKVERLGLKTYTQEIESDTGKRTRVRVGPFATRKEAEAAVAKLKAAGLPSGLLAL